MDHDGPRVCRAPRRAARRTAHGKHVVGLVLGLCAWSPADAQRNPWGRGGSSFRATPPPAPSAASAPYGTPTAPAHDAEKPTTAATTTPQRAAGTSRPCVGLELGTTFISGAYPESLVRIDWPYFEGEHPYPRTQVLAVPRMHVGWIVRRPSTREFIPAVGVGLALAPHAPALGAGVDTLEMPRAWGMTFTASVGMRGVRRANWALGFDARVDAISMQIETDTWTGDGSANARVRYLVPLVEAIASWDGGGPARFEVYVGAGFTSLSLGMRVALHRSDRRL